MARKTSAFSKQKGYLRVSLRSIQPKQVLPEKFADHARRHANLRPSKELSIDTTRAPASFFFWIEKTERIGDSLKLTLTLET